MYNGIGHVKNWPINILWVNKIWQELNGYDMGVEELAEALETDPKNGLGPDEAARRIRDYGANIIPEVRGSFWQVYLAPLFNVLITTYLIMSLILVFLAIQDPTGGIWPQAIMWSGIVAVNFLIAIIQQRRAQKKFEALRRLTQPTTRVIRESQTFELPADQLVPGDIIELEQGNRIPADARILTFHECIVNEASLTGESVPVLKNNTPALNPGTPLSERMNMVHRGTFIQIGVMKALVVRTGPHTEIGQISTELSQLSTGEIPLQNKVNALGKWLVMAVVIFLAIQLIVKGWLFSQNGFLLLERQYVIQETFTSIVAAMSVMPINIPLLSTITLLTGAIAMAVHRVVIRNLSAIESLGRISVLCSDKTGTITWSQMTVKRIYDAGKKYLHAVSGLGYGPSGIIFPVARKVTEKVPEEHVPEILTPPFPGSSYELLLICGFLNNDARLMVDEVFEAGGAALGWRAIGDPTEAALLALFNKSRLNKINIRRKYVAVREYPFDSQLKRMSKVFIIKDRDPETPGLITFSKGATEVILERCTTVGGLRDKRNLTSKEKDEIQAIADEFAKLGFRILSLSYKQLTELPPQEADEREWVEEGMTYLGFVCLLDPPRGGIQESVRKCESAGIDAIMITGDSPITAGTIAKEVDILKEGQVVHEGEEVADLDDDEFNNTAVFARVSPQHKQIIVERYQQVNRVVAMTGDGVNDALAVSMADAGIAMGVTGTDVTKQAADLIITDDSFNSIVTGIREGRGLFVKIRMMIWFYLCINLGEALVYFSTSLIPNFTLLETWQRVYIFSLIHAFPAFGLIWDRIGREIMERKPLDTEGILNRKLTKALLFTAFTLAGVISLVYFVAYRGLIPVSAYNQGGFLPLESWSSQDWAQAKARTMFLTIVFISEATLVLSIRRMDQSFFTSLRSASWFVYIMVLFVPILHFISMYYPSLQYFMIDLIGFNVENLRLAWYDWVICLGGGFTPILILELYKRHIRRKGESF
ncbi:MAG: cation-translocating P-type ATPase [Candidatus Heimdallarchaeota archaeon]